MTFNFFQNLVHNSIPTIKSYIDDLHQVSYSHIHLQPEAPSSSNIGAPGSMMPIKGEQVPTSSELAVMQKHMRDSYLRQREDFFQKMFLFKDIKEPANDILRTDSILQSLISQFSIECSMNQSSLSNDFAEIANRVERSFIPQLDILPSVDNEKSVGIVEYLRKELEGQFSILFSN